MKNWTLKRIISYWPIQLNCTSNITIIALVTATNKAQETKKKTKYTNWKNTNSNCHENWKSLCQVQIKLVSWQVCDDRRSHVNTYQLSTSVKEIQIACEKLFLGKKFSYIHFAKKAITLYSMYVEKNALDGDFAQGNRNVFSLLRAEEVAKHFRSSHRRCSLRKGFPVNFAEFLRAPFYRTPLRDCLFNIFHLFYHK